MRYRDGAVVLGSYPRTLHHLELVFRYLRYLRYQWAEEPVVYVEKLAVTLLKTLAGFFEAFGSSLD